MSLNFHSPMPSLLLVYSRFLWILLRKTTTVMLIKALPWNALGSTRKRLVFWIIDRSIILSLSFNSLCVLHMAALGNSRSVRRSLSEPLEETQCTQFVNAVTVLLSRLYVMKCVWKMDTGFFVCNTKGPSSELSVKPTLLHLCVNHNTTTNDGDWGIVSNESKRRGKLLPWTSWIVLLQLRRTWECRCMPYKFD